MRGEGGEEREGGRDGVMEEARRGGVVRTKQQVNGQWVPV